MVNLFRGERCGVLHHSLKRLRVEKFRLVGVGVDADMSRPGGAHCARPWKDAVAAICLADCAGSDLVAKHTITLLIKLDVVLESFVLLLELFCDIFACLADGGNDCSSDPKPKPNGLSLPTHKC